MDLLQQTDELFFTRTNLDLERTGKIVRDALAGGDDGELFLEMRHAEMLAFDDGRLKTASYDQSSGFGLRAVAGETPPHLIPRSNFCKKLTPMLVIRIRGSNKSAPACLDHGRLCRSCVPMAFVLPISGLWCESISGLQLNRMGAWNRAALELAAG